MYRGGMGMKDGYYLAAYISVHNFAYTYDIKLRHDQNISLWEKQGATIRLIHYWELERLTGQKGHKKSFKCHDDAVSFINSLLLPYKINYSDLEGVWGTPGLGKMPVPQIKSCFSEIPYHKLFHLFVC